MQKRYVKGMLKLLKKRKLETAEIWKKRANVEAWHLCRVCKVAIYIDAFRNGFQSSPRQGVFT